MDKKCKFGMILCAQQTCSNIAEMILKLGVNEDRVTVVRDVLDIILKDCYRFETLGYYISIDRVLTHVIHELNTALEGIEEKCTKKYL